MWKPKYIPGICSGGTKGFRNKIRSCLYRAGNESVKAKYYKNVKKGIVIFCRMWYDKYSSAGVLKKWIQHVVRLYCVMLPDLEDHFWIYKLADTYFYWKFIFKLCKKYWQFKKIRVEWLCMEGDCASERCREWMICIRYNRMSKHSFQTEYRLINLYIIDWEWYLQGSVEEHLTGTCVTQLKREKELWMI